MMKMGYTASRGERHEVDGLSDACSPALTLAQGVPRRGLLLPRAERPDICSVSHPALIF